MNNVNSTRAPFFPNGKSPTADKTIGTNDARLLRRNSSDRVKQLQNFTQKDAKVDIKDQIKDFARIKSLVDKVPDRDQSEKIQGLKEQINRGEYKIDYDALADRMLAEQF